MKRLKIFVLRRPRLRKIIFFFPLQLFFVQIKKNHVFILFWLFLFAFIMRMLASRYGVHYLFMDPEYLDRVGFVSHFIVGFSCGGFIMAYNISCYTRNAFRFPFLATLSNPFIKFCHNNCIIPGIFILVYILQLLSFLRSEAKPVEIQLLYVAGFLSGNISFIVLSLLYFFRTNTDFQRLYGRQVAEKLHRKTKTYRMVLRRNMEWKNIDIASESREWYVETYLVLPFRVRRARPFEHYDIEMLKQVFRQNHRNGVLFEIFVIITLLVLGLFRDVRFFMLPAGASIFLLFTLYLMFTSILHTWFRNWSNTVFIALLLVFNWLHQFNLFDNRTHALGMNYQTSPAVYSNDVLRSLDNNRADRVKDSLAGIAMLERWKAKNTTDSLHKPRLVLFNCSGGGLRSTLWTFYTLQCADSITGHNLMSRAAMICGSSGGMLGAAYMRELYMEKQLNPALDCRASTWRDSIARDLLNPISFSIAVNDFFLPVQKVRIANELYSKNRAFAFEQKFNENTGNRFSKQLWQYRQPEADAQIPMMVFSPTVVNDGRKMLICAQGISYLTQPAPIDNLSLNRSSDGIEFSRFFKAQNADSVQFSSVLRMNATFPYVTPLTELPSEPVIEVFDAGMRDNFGTESTLRFLHTFREWIDKNTSGIVIVQTRDMEKDRPVTPAGGRTALDGLSKPLASFYGNLFTVQNYNQDVQYENAAEWFKGPIDVLDFQLQNEEPDHISLSWHLTQHEKNRIVGSMRMAGNQTNLEKLKELLK